MAAALTLGAIWVVVLVNMRGVKVAGMFAEITTYAKLVPFGAIAIIGLFYIDGSHFSEFNPSGEPFFERDRRAGAAHDVRISWDGVGHGAGGRRARSRAHYPALDRAWHHDRGDALHPRHGVVMGVVPREQLWLRPRRSPTPRA